MTSPWSIENTCSKFWRSYCILKNKVMRYSAFVKLGKYKWLSQTESVAKLGEAEIKNACWTEKTQKTQKGYKARKVIFTEFLREKLDHRAINKEPASMIKTFCAEVRKKRFTIGYNTKNRCTRLHSWLNRNYKSLFNNDMLLSNEANSAYVPKCVALKKRGQAKIIGTKIVCQGIFKRLPWEASTPLVKCINNSTEKT